MPTNPLPYATKFDIKVASREGLLYPLSETKTATFETPRLEVLTPSQNFSPLKGIPLSFNTPVKTADLIPLLHVTEFGKDIGVTAVTENGAADAGRRFLIVKNSSPGLAYSSDYKVTFSGSITPVGGNLAMTGSKSYDFRSTDFLQNTQVFRSIYSETGALIDTKEMSDLPDPGKPRIIPSNQLFFVLSFGEEIDIAKIKPYLVSKDGRSECKLSYTQNENEAFEGGKKVKKLVDDKYRLKCEIGQKLADDTEYALTIDRSSNEHIKADIVEKMKTAPKFIASDFTYVSNTESCIYFTSPLTSKYQGTYGLETQFETTPKSPIRSIREDDTSIYNEVTNIYQTVDLCKSIPGKYAYVLGTRFQPHSSYDLRIKPTLGDQVGNPIAQPFEKKGIVAGDIKDADKYVYSPVSKNINVIPSSLPIIANLQTINLNEVNIEICETDIAGYADYLTNFYNG